MDESGIQSESESSDGEEEPEDLLLDYRGQDNSSFIESNETNGHPEEADAHVSANVYSSGKEKKAVLQVEHYAKRGKDLRPYSLYEYCATITVVENPKQRKSKDSTSTTTNTSDKSTVENASAVKLGSMEGRTPNGTFPFHPTHPLYETHVQRIRSKFKVPVLIKNPPKPPPPKPKNPSREWKTAARNFAHYFLVVYRPWLEEDGTLPGEMSWKDFCSWMKDLQFGTRQNDGKRIGATPLDTVRRRWIENAAQGI